jgi:galactokinase
MIVQSGTHRELVEGHYNERRRACEAAARQLGVASLRDATLADVEDGRLNPLLRRRARHVVSETARTEAAVAAIAAGDIRRLGALLGASHASLRDDFEVSVPPVDRLVDAVNDALAGEGGARMTGGGFGGAIVAILPATAVPTATAAAERTLGRKLAPPDLMVERPGAETAALA